MNTLSTLTILPGNKKEITEYCNKAKNEILEGNNNPLLILKQLKALELVIKTLLSDNDLKYCFQSEAMKYTGTTFEHIGCEFQLKNGVSKWNYSVCNDSEYIQIKNKASEVNNQKKAREKFLQSLKEPYVNEDIGETILPPIKEQSEILSVKLK